LGNPRVLLETHPQDCVKPPQSSSLFLEVFFFWAPPPASSSQTIYFENCPNNPMVPPPICLLSQQEGKLERGSFPFRSHTLPPAFSQAKRRQQPPPLGVFLFGLSLEKLRQPQKFPLSYWFKLISFSNQPPPNPPNSLVPGLLHHGFLSVNDLACPCGQRPFYTTFAFIPPLFLP